MLCSFSKFLLEQGELVCQAVSLLVLYVCRGCWQPPFLIFAHGNMGMPCREQPDQRNIGTKIPGQARPVHNGKPLRTHVQPRGSWQTKDLSVCFFIQQFTLPVTAWSSHGRRRRRRRQIVTLLHVWAVRPSLIRAVVPHGSFAQQL